MEKLWCESIHCGVTLPRDKESGIFIYQPLYFVQHWEKLSGKALKVLAAGIMTGKLKRCEWATNRVCYNASGRPPDLLSSLTDT